MKASDLRKEVEASQRDDEKVQNHVNKNDPFYDEIREKAAASYLEDVGAISQYINQHMDKIAKEHDGMGK